MDIFTFVKTQIEQCSNEQLMKVAADTGVPYKTLLKVKYGETTDPRISTIQPLLHYFQMKVAA